MISNPDQYVETFREAGADHLSVHVEACTIFIELFKISSPNGMKAGVALNPHTNVLEIEDILEDVDIVILMSVNPGFGGQNLFTEPSKNIKAPNDR